MNRMMGEQARPEQLFYDFRLDDHVPADHLLRQIDGHDQASSRAADDGLYPFRPTRCDRC